MALIQLVAGFVLLVAGAEALVRGASRLAAAFGVSPLVIGLTVVAYGTSTPELAVSAIAAAEGTTDIALGNAVGSNIFNVLLILGLSAAIAPLLVSQALVRRDVPLMIGVSILAWLLALDGGIGRIDGAVLLGGIIAYTVFLVRQSRRGSGTREPQNVAAASDEPARLRGTLMNVVWVAVGLGLLVAGSNLLVDGAVAVARSLGVSELIIGLTIVAAGTSLPEVATSVLASLRGQRDIAVGNVVGSNIYNILGVLGLSAVLAPGGLPVSAAALGFDVPVMIAVAVACLPIFFTGRMIARWEGVLFLCYYVAYTAYLVLAAAEHDALPLFSTTMLVFVIPLTVVTLLVISWRAARSDGKPPPGSGA
jgi:cation:H+ antiporter